MSKQIGRDGKHVKKASTVVGTEDSEELALEPKDDAIKAALPRSSIEWSKNDIPRVLFSSRDPDVKEDLILEPTVPRRSREGVSISHQRSRVSAQLDRFDEREELMLSPNVAVGRISTEPALPWARQAESIAVDSTREAHGGGQSELLQLSPRDDSARVNRSKNYSWSRASPNASSAEKRFVQSEELLLSPTDKATRFQQGKLVEWAKAPEDVSARSMKRLIADEEELQLDPADDHKSRMAGKGAAPWSTHAELVRHTGMSPIEGPRHPDDDEVILSPKDESSKPNVNRGSLSWARQADSRATERAAAAGLEEDRLILSPKLDRKPKQSVPWNKQSSDLVRNADINRALRNSENDLYEELILSPAAAERVRSSVGPAWSKQNDIDPGAVAAGAAGEHEELILELAPARNSRKTDISWDRQAETGRGVRPDVWNEDEELILSPASNHRSGPAGASANVWSKMQGRPESPTLGAGGFRSDELILDPKSGGRIDGSKGAALWARNSGGEELNPVAYFDSEELKLSVHDDKSHQYRGQFSRKEKDEVKDKEFEDEELKLSPKLSKKGDQGAGLWSKSKKPSRSGNEDIGVKARVDLKKDATKTIDEEISSKASTAKVVTFKNDATDPRRSDYEMTKTSVPNLKPPRPSKAVVDPKTMQRTESEKSSTRLKTSEKVKIQPRNSSKTTANSEASNIKESRGTARTRYPSPKSALSPLVSPPSINPPSPVAYAPPPKSTHVDSITNLLKKIDL
jgi:hypothetical protein